MLLGLLVGIAGPILLWFSFSVARRPFEVKLGFLFLLVGLGLVVIAIPLMLAEAGRLERTSSYQAQSYEPPIDQTARGSGLGRVFAASRVMALIGVLVIFAGAYLVRPAEATAVSGDSSSSQRERADRGDNRGNDNRQRNNRGNRGGRGGGGEETPPVTTPPPPTP